MIRKMEKEELKSISGGLIIELNCTYRYMEEWSERGRRWIMWV